MDSQGGLASTPSETGVATQLEDVIATSKLYDRASRPADFKAENEALISLVEVMSRAPETVLQKLTEVAMALCKASAAGISLTEVDAGEEIFRWRATAGTYSEYLNGTMPRYFSPCGVVLERDAPVLMIDMVKYYPYISALNLPPQEVLLVPFRSQGQAVGTLWIVAHDDSRRFDREDLRILQSLTNFASVAVQAFARTHELEQANAAASAMGDLREQFIAVLGHDLRNPLAAITNSTQLLAMGMPPERVPVLARMITQSARRIGELADNLLDFTRGRLGGGISLHRRELDSLAPALAHVARELEASHASGRVETHFDFKVPVTVDPDRIAQMVSNLVGNALTHGDGSPVQLTGRSADGALVITVTNRGLPIPPDIAARLFEPFERGGKAGNREGLGLGLYIASEIASAHGGDLTVHSGDEETTFRFVMPQP